MEEGREKAVEWLEGLKEERFVMDDFEWNRGRDVGDGRVQRGAVYAV